MAAGFAAKYRIIKGVKERILQRPNTKVFAATIGNIALCPGDHALVDLACIGHFNPKNITVRSKSRDLLSTDSVSVAVPAASRRRTKPEIGGRASRGGRGRGLGGRRGGRREMVSSLNLKYFHQNIFKIFSRWAARS